MNGFKAVIMLLMVSMPALLFVQCGPSSETEEVEDVIAEDEEIKDEDVEAIETAGLPIEITNSIGMKFRLIPAGSFLMGSDSREAEDWEKPVHRVEITRQFYMGVHEVTQAQYEAVMGNNPSKFKGENFPVEQVFWDNVQQFLSKLNDLAISQGKNYRYRLPSEAEWEYATRAGSRTKFYWGDEMDDDYAWYIGNSGELTPHPVGQKRPNAWGLYDMSGNVWEWCSDWFDKDYYSISPSSNPAGPSSGKGRALRGGSWGNNRVILRSAYRGGHQPAHGRVFGSGFRVVREVE